VIEPRFPERAPAKLELLTKQRDQLAEFLESFVAECGQYSESKAHIEACDKTLIKFATVTEAVVGSLAVQKAIDDRTGPLEYGLSYALDRLNSGLDAGIPDVKGQEKVDDLTAKKDKIAEWLETFKSECGQYAEAVPHVAACQDALDKWDKVVPAAEGQLKVRAAIDDRSGPLEYGLSYQLRS
jgi:hypothetical protein